MLVAVIHSYVTLVKAMMLYLNFTNIIEVTRMKELTDLK